MPDLPELPPKKGQPPPAQQRYTAQQVADALTANRGLVSGAAQALKCSPQTVRAYMARYPTVADALHEAREATTDLAEAALIQAIKTGQGWAVCFYLKTQGKHRGYIERHELTGADGGPIETAVTLTDNERAARVTALLGRGRARQGEGA